MKAIRICHLTSVHTRTDTRVFYKECISLSDHYEVYLIVADGNGDETRSNINIVDVGKPTGRISRFLFTTKKIRRKAISLHPAICHFHDPELIFQAYKILKKKMKIIYDVHEDLPRQIFGKPYLHNFIKKPLSMIIEFFENRYSRKFNYIITATPHIKNRFKKINSETENVNNYPIISESVNSVNWYNKKDEICYIGDITKIRGVKEIVKALEYVNADLRLNLAGNFDSQGLKDEITHMAGWQKVNELGYIDRQKVRSILDQSKIGLVVLHPTINYTDALPVKMFEYMEAGLPVICSDFPYWVKIIEEFKCGIAVNPFKPEEIAAAIEFLFTNEEAAKEMGLNGKKAVADGFSWNNEEKKLLKIYHQLS